MKFQYLAMDENGHERTGTVDGDDLSAAARQLRAEGLFPVELKTGSPGTSEPKEPGGFSFGRVGTRDVIFFCRQLALMLRTGLTLLAGLRILSLQSRKQGMREAAKRLAERVQEGVSLSEALETDRKIFGPMVVQLVRTAEATGELDAAFDQAADYLERRSELRTQLLTSLLYPGIVVLVSIGVFWFLSTKVVPKFARFLLQREVSLPWTTQLLLDISAFFQAYGLAILGGLTVLGFSIFVLYRTSRGKTALDGFVLSVPLIGLLIKTASTAHLSRTLALLLKSGLPLLESLRILGQTFGNQRYIDLMSEASERVVAGAGLSESLKSRHLPDLCTRVVAVGEETGALDSVLFELAAFYEARLQRLLKLLSSLFEPAAILCVGGMVGFIYLSFFHAIFKLTAR